MLYIDCQILTLCLGILRRCNDSLYYLNLNGSNISCFGDNSIRLLGLAELYLSQCNYLTDKGKNEILFLLNETFIISNCYAMHSRKIIWYNLTVMFSFIMTFTGLLSILYSCGKKLKKLDLSMTNISGEGIESNSYNNHAHGTLGQPETKLIRQYLSNNWLS